MATPAVFFEIPGVPAAWGRARANLKTGTFFTPKKTRHREALVGAIAHNEMQRRGLTPFMGAVELDILAVFPIPTSWPKWKREAALAAQIHHTIKPDRDNLEKAIKDGLSGVVWRDDCQVVDGRTKKMYSHTANTWITVKPLAGAHAGMKTLAEFNAAILPEGEVA